MKIKNSTDFSDAFLRRMVSWCAKQIDFPFPVHHTQEATFCNSKRRAYSGRAWGSRRRLVRIGPGSLFPLAPYTRYGIPLRYRTRIETLVHVTTHELGHLKQVREGLKRTTLEKDCERHAARVLVVFLENRDTLLRQWDKTAYRITKPKPTLQERRAAQVAIRLAAWEKRLRRAQNKVKEYRRKSRYYDRKRAAKRKEETHDD